MALTKNVEQTSMVTTEYHRISSLGMLYFDSGYAEIAGESYLNGDAREMGAAPVARNINLNCNLTLPEMAAIQSILYRAVKRIYFPDATDDYGQGDFDMDPVISHVESLTISTGETLDGIIETSEEPGGMDED